MASTGAVLRSLPATEQRVREHLIPEHLAAAVNLQGGGPPRCPGTTDRVGDQVEVAFLGSFPADGAGDDDDEAEDDDEGADDEGAPDERDRLPISLSAAPLSPSAAWASCESAAGVRAVAGVQGLALDSVSDPRGSALS
jgi:hypothetical protein